MRYAITIQYIGAAYCGWQSQKNGVSIQDTVEAALSKVFNHPVRVTASGRTDEGVNALGQVAHFDSDREIKPYNLCRGANVFLPKDVAIVDAKIVSDDFNARKSAKRKTYVYKMYVSYFRNPTLDIDHKQIFRQPDITLMRRAAKYIEGKHDFRCFMSTGSNQKTTVREVYDCSVTQEDNIITVSVTGNAFLYNMVRAITGTLLFVGYGKINADDIPKIISGGVRQSAGKTMPPNGLTLFRVDYE